MHIKIRFSTDGDSFFGNDPYTELGYVMERAKDTLMTMGPDETRPIRDTNGNTIGQIDTEDI